MGVCQHVVQLVHVVEFTNSSYSNYKYRSMAALTFIVLNVRRVSPANLLYSKVLRTNMLYNTVVYNNYFVQ